MPDRDPQSSPRRGSRVVVTLVLVVGAALLLTGCILPIVPAPGGAGPLRYRDLVFSAVSRTNDVTYGSAPDLAGNAVTLELDVYQPAGDTVTQRPALVWVHGGGFCCGDKGDEATQATTFARKGYLVVSINYRLLATSGCSGASGVSPACYTAATEAVHDGQAAVRWLRANAAIYHVDPDRIGIGGESAGAIVATGAGLHSEDPGTSGNPGYSSTVQGWVSISGGLPNGLYAGAGDAPGMLFSGTADTIVPYQWSVDTSAALDAAHVPVVLETLNGAGHVPPQFFAVYQTQSINFFYRYLALAGGVDS